jgi:predicted nucleic acid-binding protein
VTGRTVILDSEALSGLARQDKTALVTLSAVLETDQRLIVPTAVLVEVLTGQPTDAAVWHVVNGLTTVDLTVPIAARAAALRQRAERARRKQRDLSIDAIVMATAEAFAPAVIVTADVPDLTLLTDRPEVRVTGL